ncbi:hypothetical protein [Plantactinospora sp. CA-290183]|uniref:hypothetical protein n=1 Tax=Plantactinospora sp. CA-290183 TaxID=3240006 RepID=UPI003D90C11E
MRDPDVMSESLRITGGCSLETPVEYYTHRDCEGWSVVLVGTYPIGEASYYTRLRRIVHELAGAPGAVVDFEEVPWNPPEDRLRASTAERRVVGGLIGAEELQIGRAETLGWVAKQVSFQPSAGWRVHGIRALELVRRAGLVVMEERARAVDQLLDWRDGDRRGPARYRLAVARAVRLQARSRPAGLEHPALVMYRAEAAVRAIDQVNRQQVLVWDVQILPRLRAELLGRGLVRQRVEWHRVGQLPHRGAAVASLLLGWALQPWPSRTAAAQAEPTATRTRE